MCNCLPKNDLFLTTQKAILFFGGGVVCWVIILWCLGRGLALAGISVFATWRMDFATWQAGFAKWQVGFATWQVGFAKWLRGLLFLNRNWDKIKKDIRWNVPIKKFFCWENNLFLRSMLFFF